MGHMGPAWSAPGLLTYEDLQLPDVPDTARTAGLATAGSSTASGTPPAAPVTREVVVKARRLLGPWRVGCPSPPWAPSMGSGIFQSLL